MPPLTNGALFKTSVGALYRLLAIAPDASTPVAYVLNMDEARSLPRAISLESLIAGIEAGEYRPVPAPAGTGGGALPGRVPMSAPITAVYRRRRDLIAPLVDDRRIYEADYRVRLATARAMVRGTSTAHVLGCLQMYWRAGMSFETLLPAQRVCGASAATSRVPHGERRPRVRSEEGGYAF